MAVTYESEICVELNPGEMFTSSIKNIIDNYTFINLSIYAGSTELHEFQSFIYRGTSVKLYTLIYEKGSIQCNAVQTFKKSDGTFTLVGALKAGDYLAGGGEILSITTSEEPVDLVDVYFPKGVEKHYWCNHLITSTRRS